MLTPKAFVMGEPHMSYAWTFSLTIDRKYWDFVEALPCVHDVNKLNGNLMHVYIDARYDYEEAWLWIYEQLEAETREVNLGAVWDGD